jgi:hypothetical protein
MQLGREVLKRGGALGAGYGPLLACGLQRARKKARPMAMIAIAIKSIQHGGPRAWGHGACAVLVWVHVKCVDVARFHNPTRGAHFTIMAARIGGSAPP